MPHTDARSVLAATIAVTAPVLAQTFHTVPAYADVVDGHESLGLPFGTLVDFGSLLQPDPGAVVIRFDGVFF